MIKNIFLLSYLYTVIITIITIWYTFFYNNIAVDFKITLIFFIALFPFFDMVFSSIRSNNNINNNNISVVKTILFIIISIILLSFTSTLALSALLMFMLANIIFSFDTRYIFLWALTYIILTWFFVILWDKIYSELFSIHAYYLLIFGVIKEIYLSITHANTQSNNTSLHNIRENIMSKYTNIKNAILTDIWENIQPIDSSPDISTSPSWLYVKLYHYTLSKVRIHIQNIVLSLFVISVIISILNLYINLYYLVM